MLYMDQHQIAQHDEILIKKFACPKKYTKEMFLIKLTTDLRIQEPLYKRVRPSDYVLYRRKNCRQKLSFKKTMIGFMGE
ncbi:hypothetical protein T4B_6675 [Trichinella pseudospiralis]|uniref:Uncharacterized protein n=1 Tax=Trichinella pseudospiralis TaxID=6337 RepID=A0A0V1GUG1_TRIPS|nr:hypothetical protein T4B_6675 [Trichinella pseudospiralis]